MVADAQRAEQGEHQGSFLTDLDKMDADRFRGSFSGDEKDVFFINDGGGFFDAHALLGFDDVLDGRAVVPIDVNGDGRLDLAHRSLDGIRLYLNRIQNTNRHIELELKAKSLSLAEGAEVVIKAKDRRLLRRVSIDGSFHAQLPLRAHFGVDADIDAVDVEVRWSNGKRAEFKALATQRRHIIRYGRKGTVVKPIARWPLESLPVTAATATGADMVLDPNGQRVPLARNGRVTLVQLWAPWCEPCRAEFPHLNRLARDQADRVAVIGLGVEPDATADYRAFWETNAMAYPLRMATPELLKKLFPEGRLKLPTTLLFDATGQLVRRFSGLLTQAELKALLKPFDGVGTKAEDFVWQAELAQQNEDTLAVYQALREAVKVAGESPALVIRAAYAADQAGQTKQALDWAHRAVVLGPKNAETWRALVRLTTKYRGVKAVAGTLSKAPDTVAIMILKSEVYEAVGQPAQALTFAQRALAAQPQSKEAQKRFRWLTDPDARKLDLRDIPPLPLNKK